MLCCHRDSLLGRLVFVKKTIIVLHASHVEPATQAELLAAMRGGVLRWWKGSASRRRWWPGPGSR